MVGGRGRGVLMVFFFRVGGGRGEVVGMEA